MIKKIGIYVDGFNLFFGALKHPDRKKYRWLNIEELVKQVCSSYLKTINYEIECIKFCTARVKPRTPNDSSPKKQQIYFNALKTMTHFELILGNFLVHPKLATIFPIEFDEKGKTKRQMIIHTEEKGSDVNLAAYFMADAFKNKVDIAIMITNDTDLVTPLKIVSEELGKTVIVISPFKDTAFSIKKLNKVIKYNISTSHLAKSQFPTTMQIGEKTFQKPEDWE